MKVIFLGTASCYPTPNRGVSATAIQFDDGQIWLFDCGEGTQVQLQRSSLHMGKITKIFITHLHGDHVFGLPGLLLALGLGLDKEDLASKRVDLYGPHGLRRLVMVALELSRSPIKYPCFVHEMQFDQDQLPADWHRWQVKHDADSDSKIFRGAHSVVSQKSEAGDRFWTLAEEKKSPATVIAVAIKHRVPCFGFVITEPDLPGQLDMDKVRKAGLSSGPACGQLKRGYPVELPDGSLLQPDQVLGPKISGRKVVILGDTCDASEVLPFSRNCDLLIHEATMENGNLSKALEYGHSTPDMAAKLAHMCKAKRLCLTHLSPRYKPVAEVKSPDDLSAQLIRDEAQSYLCSVGSDCTLELAEDFFELSLARLKSCKKARTEL